MLERVTPDPELSEIHGGWQGQNDRGRSLKEMGQPEFSEEAPGSFYVIGYVHLSFCKLFDSLKLYPSCILLL